MMPGHLAGTLQNLFCEHSTLVFTQKVIWMISPLAFKRTGE
jgi:hypothetical protein